GATQRIGAGTACGTGGPVPARPAQTELAVGTLHSLYGLRQGLTRDTTLLPAELIVEAGPLIGQPGTGT
ncbi:MAG TPA: hypothetical protein VHK66_04575, partial [Microvirga sp.]|nr:hypothetical protein [Microvirga sp.]